jgi:hypothetical protein
MIPEFPNFKNIELPDKESINKFTCQYPPYSDFNFISMWSWDIRGQMKISQLNDNLVVLFNDYLTGEPFYSFLGKNCIEDTVEKIMNFSEKEGFGLKLRLIHEEVRENNTNKRYIFLPDEDNFDYVYNIKDLFECSGRKYETQRNLINRFNKQSDGVRVEFFDSLNSLKEDILNLDNDWAKSKIKTDGVLEFRNESEALKRIFDFKDNNLCATCIFKNDVLIAFCINELIPDSDYALAHFAKANILYPGIYAFLLNNNCKFLLAKNKKYLNYEQDLGLPQLRYSKNAFKPIHFLKKYTLIKP